MNDNIHSFKSHRLRRTLFPFGKSVAVVVLGIAVLYLSFFAGYLAGRQSGSSQSNVPKVVNTDIGKPKDVDFSVYWEVWNQIKDKTSHDIDPAKMVQGSIAGMVASLGDPYTVFMGPAENKRFNEDISGEFGGIGVEIVQKNGLPTVVAPLEDSPAQRAGLKSGDIIVEVDGTKTSEVGFDETINRIRGEKGTTVKLLLLREGNDEPVTIEVVRDVIVIKSLQSEYRDVDGKKILHVKIRQFGKDTESLFEEVVKEVQKNKPYGIVVDLRNNPGGYLETSVDLTSYFVDGGVVVTEKGKNGRTREYRTTSKSLLKNYRLVVLVNKGSASASEIFAGAIQDRGQGKVVGEKTFGKGSVQELVDISNGSALKVTVAKWFTPNGRQINDQGIEPDIEVADDENTKEDEQLDRAFNFLLKGE